MTADLRARILAAVATGAALAACKTTEPPSGSVALPDPSVPVPVPASSSASASASSSPPSAPSAPRPRSCAAPDKRETTCHTAFAAPSHTKSNPPRHYDKSGCLPDEEVAESCSGITGVVSGPTKQGNKCCYVVCQGLVPPCGRPLLGDDEAPRVAPLYRITGDGARARIDEPRDRWLADAVMEHASVASFARFVLELEAVGAPARLVDDARRAGLDEIEHTRLCLAMAMRGERADTRFELGDVSLEGITIRDRLAAIAASAASEACVGETFSALEASARALAEEDPIARGALATIAGDEARHAALGWSFVSWAVARGGAEVASAVRASTDRALARLGDTEPARHARAIVRDAIRLVVDVDTPAGASLDAGTRGATCAFG
ncbi:MAG: hypothetical protein JST00_01960 [Deltaproteobacteria bacterium]|nr:hypothetical protein [Deltaproteobacteria bacterium]